MRSGPAVALLVSCIACSAWVVAEDEAEDPPKTDKRLEASPLRALGWKPATRLDAGLAATYAWFAEHAEGARAPFVAGHP